MVPPFLASRSRACPASTRPREAMGRSSSRRPSWVPQISTYLLRSVTPALRLFQRPRAERQPQAQPQQQEHGGTGQRRDVRRGQRGGSGSGRAQGTAPGLGGCGGAQPRLPATPLARGPARPAPGPPRAAPCPSRVPTALGRRPCSPASRVHSSSHGSSPGPSFSPVP